MPYSIKTDAADCKGYAVVDENGKTVACHTNRKAALDNQRALYANVPDATRKENPTVSDVHVDSGMGRVRVKRPTFSKNVDVLIAQHYELHNKTSNPSEAQLYVHHNILNEVQKAGMDCYCSCGNWSQPLVIDNVTTDLQTLQKSENPSLGPVKQIIQTGIDNGYKFADVLQMLDIGGYMMVVRPKEIVQEPSESMDVEDSLGKSILSKIKDLLNKVSEPSLAGSVAEGGTATIVGEIKSLFKADEKRFTLGPWYIPDRADAHGEWTDPEELQKALWNYVKSGDRRIRLQHNKNVVAGEWVETMTWPYPVTVPITKADGSMGEHTYPTGTVFMGVQWEPWAWEMVKAGKLTGYSIGGKAERILVDLPEEPVKKKLDNLDKANPYRDGSTGRFTTGGAGMGAGVASSILERVKANGGLSVNMVNGSEPTSGYMVAKGTEYGQTVSAEDFYDPEKGPKILADYMKQNKEDLGTGKNYLGLWHNTEDGKVYLDVSENILDRGEAITAGQSRDQISIWDVANFEEVQTGGTGVTKQEVGSRRNPGEHFNNDGR
jgi:hypothetical protein